MLHNTQCLGQPGGREIYDALEKAQNHDLINNIGYSVYNPEELDNYFSDFPPNLVQLPANAFDQRFMKSGWLQKLETAGVEIHIRSVFLQGLLLIECGNYHSYFDPWKKLFEEWTLFWKSSFNSPIEACLAPFFGLPDCYTLIVGVESVNQLRAILSAASELSSNRMKDFEISDLKLLNPSLWNF